MIISRFKSLVAPFRAITAVTAAMVLSVPFAAPSAAQERRWIQVEALPGLARANERAADFATEFGNVWGFGLPSGWYGVVLGPYDGAEVGSVLSALKSGARIPADSYITDGAEFRAQFWPPEGSVPETVLQPEVAVGALPDPVAEPVPEPEVIAGQVAEPAVIEETPAEARASEAALDLDQRKELQVALQWFGFYNGGIDGAFGPGTRNSMAAWQAASGHEASGILTTAQRAALVGAHQGEVAAFGFALVEEQESGIDATLPLALVEFDRYEPPFVHFREKNGSGLSIVLISQPGDASSLGGLYEVISSLTAMPAGGARERSDTEIRLTGQTGDQDGRAWARLSGGLIKGWMAFGKPQNAGRDARVFEVIDASFRAVGDTALDPGLVPLDEAARRGLVAGLEVRQPIRNRSGFYVSKAGAVLTTVDAVKTCARITLDHAVEAKLMVEDAASGLAVLQPVTALAPPAVAEFSSGTRPGAGVVIAGYPYEGRLPAPVLTHGAFEEAGGLDGAAGMLRLTVATRPGDAGGAVIDGSGAVLGMLLPELRNSTRDLPADVAFAADAAQIAAVLGQASITPLERASTVALPPETLTREARGMTVLVSCWDQP
ncbi:serine protease [Rhodobacter sp. 24-YEA-8]|uniref:serine protease n=1 Tax=Rhodobacter sp. 24-YEA-8 TaxID=1884310 RepID=UPI00089AC12A|nr:serine protease [Rhodobacter sp. 24-YEA-8]SEB99343.1 Trypsin-like peptidase domain-containing protein [Rhodobacter sp. 24-YEA-8]